MFYLRLFCLIVPLCAIFPFAGHSQTIITVAGIPDIEAEVPYLAHLKASSGTAPYTWTLLSAPPGLSVDSAAATLSGTLTSCLTQFPQIEVNVKDSAGHSQDWYFEVLCFPRLHLNSQTVQALAGKPLADQSGRLFYLFLTGGKYPVTTSIVGLPPGVTYADLNFAGTPTTPGTYNASVQSTDALGVTASAIVTFEIASPLAFITTALPEGIVGKTYNASLAATGGFPPYLFHFSGTLFDPQNPMCPGSRVFPGGPPLLPPGIQCTPAGLFTGVPTTPGITEIPMTVMDSINNSAAVTLILKITGSGLFITTSFLDATATLPWGDQILTTGGIPPLSFALIAGSLPPGVTLNTTTGQMYGPATAGGSYSFTIRVTDSTGQVATGTIDFPVRPAPLALVGTALPPAHRGVPYFQRLVAVGGTPPYYYQFFNPYGGGKIPFGLTLDNNSGVMSGTVSDLVGMYGFGVQLLDSSHAMPTQGYQVYSMLVNAADRDFRGGGRSDALLYDPVSGTSYSALSNGDGTYHPVANLFTPAFDILRSGDFNGDGLADLVVYNSHTALAYIGMSKGDGTFDFHSLFWSAGYDFVEAGDLNQDTKTDFALYNSSNGTMYTAISNGNGTFSYKYTLISKGYTFVRLADFTGDGKADIFLYNAATGAASLGTGDGAGGFTFNPLLISPGYNLADIGDLDGDGRTDLVLYNGTNGNAATGISDGVGGFKFTALLFSSGFTSVRLSDYTGDGQADLTLYNMNNAAAYFGTGMGTGAFSFQSLFWSPGYDSIQPQDVNGDGKTDILLYNSGTGTEYTGINNGYGAFAYTYQYWGLGRVLAR